MFGSTEQPVGTYGADAESRAARCRALPAGLFPNPELVARMESAPLTESVTEQAEYVIGVSQTVPLGGRLALARRVELLDRDRALHELAAKRLDIHRQVQSAFATALYWQRVIQAREDEVRSAANGVALANARLTAGETIPAEVASGFLHFVVNDGTNIKYTSAQFPPGLRERGRRPLG